MHAGKTLRRPGATPLWTAFSRPNVCGVAPGLSPRNGDRVLPACRNRRMQDVRQNVRQSQRGGRAEHHGNHQGTT
jgi:hypothetical protein